MGLLGKLTNSIAKGVGDAISKAAENAIAPAAEKLTNKIAESLNQASENIEEVKPEAKTGLQAAMERLEQAANNYAEKLESLGIGEDDIDSKALYVTVLKQFPEWKLTKIDEVNGDDTDEYTEVDIYVTATQEQLDQYHQILVEAGFSEPGQIQRKIVDGKEHAIDFSFALDGELRYIIYK